MPVNASVDECAQPTQLSGNEQRDLERIESTIAAKLTAFFEVGYALIQIKTRELYRAEFRTFEEYCHVRWEFNRAHAYRLIGAAEVCKSLSPMGDVPLPQRERQVRPLLGLPPKLAIIAWKKAYESAGSSGAITGLIVERAVRDVTRRKKSTGNDAVGEYWQSQVTSALREALHMTKAGDKAGVLERANRVILLLSIGERRGGAGELE
jgi:hypothetical protein